jgi:nitrous oxidase accessory protein NosD
VSASLLRHCVLLTAVAGVAVAPLHAETIVVGPSDGSCPGAIFSHIQSALDAAVPGTSITICAGVYPEQLLIAKPVIVRAAPGTRLQPGRLNALATSFRTGRPVAAAVTIRAKATLAGLAVDVGDNGIATCDGTEPLLAGVFVLGASATVSGTSVGGVRIANAPPGCSNGVGILVQAGGAVRIRLDGDTLAGYQRAGIVVEGPDVRARITSNVVTGDGATSDRAQTGIEIDEGASAQIEGNVVRAHAGPSGAACSLDAGIALGAARARVRNNQLESNAVGIAATTRGHLIASNTVDGGDVGFFGILLDGDETRLTTNDVRAHAAAGIRIDGHRNRASGNSVAAVHATPACDAARATPGCAPVLARCGVGLWLAGQANRVVGTTISDVDTTVADDGRGNVVR